MIKKFSSPKIKIWFEPMFLTGSLAVFKSAVKPARGIDFSYVVPRRPVRLGRKTLPPAAGSAFI